MKLITKAIVAGAIYASFHVAQYIFEEPLLLRGETILGFTLAWLILIPISLFAASSESVLQNFKTNLSVYLIAVVLIAITQLLIHHVLDKEFKNRLAIEYLARITEHTKELEHELNARITSIDDNDILYETEIEKYSLRNLLLAPLQFLPLATIMSLMNAFVLSALKKRRRSYQNREL